MNEIPLVRRPDGTLFLDMEVAINRKPLQQALDRFKRICAHLQMAGRDSTYFRAVARCAIDSQSLARVVWEREVMIVLPGQPLLDLLVLYPEVP